jgi:hypothetical protein
MLDERSHPIAGIKKFADSPALQAILPDRRQLIERFFAREKARPA